jgi:hypothetical protein
MVDPNGGGTMSRSRSSSATPKPKGASNSGKMPAGQDRVRKMFGVYLPRVSPCPRAGKPERFYGSDTLDPTRVPRPRG